MASEVSGNYCEKHNVSFYYSCLGCLADHNRRRLEQANQDPTPTASEIAAGVVAIAREATKALVGSASLNAAMRCCDSNPPDIADGHPDSRHPQAEQWALTGNVSQAVSRTAPAQSRPVPYPRWVVDITELTSCDPTDRMVDGFSIRDCLVRYENMQRNDSVHDWLCLTDLQFEAAQDAWSCQLRTLQAKSRDAQAAQVVLERYGDEE